jgi:hypothetical protein
MASIEFQQRAIPKKDGLGLSFFIFHSGVGGFVLAGWLISSFEALLVYLLLLPAMALQWAVNRRSCIINNLESWIRTGQWRDPHNCEEGAFLLTICESVFAVRPGRVALDRVSHGTVLSLWLLGLGHIYLLGIA